MDKMWNLSSVDTYDSDFTIEEIEEQTKEHFAEMDTLMNAKCGNCEWFNGTVEDRQQFCDELENYVPVNFYCNRYSKR